VNFEIVFFSLVVVSFVKPRRVEPEGAYKQRFEAARYFVYYVGIVSSLSYVNVGLVLILLPLLAAYVERKSLRKEA
jgi:hypothetical protein